jgi:enoyl-CoA hydratase/carnithine racemase
MGPDFEVAFTYIMSIRKPIIVALNGVCAGLGMSIALLCDMRFASENGRFVTAFSQRGLVAEHGQSWILPRLIGPARALDILWSSRRIDAAEAMEMGLVQRIFPQDELLDQTKAYIQDLADRAAPVSMMVMKQQIYRHLNMSLGDAMKETNKLMAESLVKDDFAEGVKSFMEKRPPQFNKVEIS